MIRVLIAEDMHLIRGALAALLSLEPDMEVVAELERGDEIVPTALERRPDVAVVDIDLPGMDGLTAAEQLGEQLPECRILVLTGLSQPGKTVDIADMLSEERIEDGILLAGEIISEPPHPIAAFGDEKFFVGQLPLVLDDLAYAAHQRLPSA